VAIPLRATLELTCDVSGTGLNPKAASWIWHVATAPCWRYWRKQISQPDIKTCLEKGLNVIHRDIELGLEVFEDRSFDYVLTTHSIQTLRYPAHTLLEMVRVGVKGIVSFPNMGFWSNRLSIGVLGKMPRTRSLPHEWHDTPNTHLCTLRDFENLCKELDINILRRAAVSNTHDKSLGSTVLPNLFSETALYEITAK